MMALVTRGQGGTFMGGSHNCPPPLNAWNGDPPDDPSTSRSQIANELERLGLGPQEADLYLRLLEVGPAKVSSIEPLVDASRRSLYRQLDQLCEKGLASKSLKRPTRYQARDPETLFEARRRALDRRRAEVDALEETLAGPLDKVRKGAPGSTPTHWERVEGTPRIYEAAERLVDEADASIEVASNHPICLRTGFPPVEHAWDAIAARASEGLDTRVLLDASEPLPPELASTLDVDGLELRGFDAERTIHFILADGEDLVVWVRTNPIAGPDQPDPVALHTNAPALVAAQAELFEQLWTAGSEIAREPPRA